jgi:ATP-dependent 26S proteasome regulatory subunit
MDEIDSIGSARMEGGGGDSEVQRTMLELLNQLDGFEPAQNIKVRLVASTFLPKPLSLYKAILAYVR